MGDNTSKPDSFIMSWVSLLLFLKDTVQMLTFLHQSCLYHNLFVEQTFQNEMIHNVGPKTFARKHAVKRLS